MKKYKKVILSGVFILIVAMSFVLGRFSNTENEYLEDKPKQVKEKNLLSYYLEDENGEYVASTSETWPTEGYKFNATLSKCENGGELGWDETKGVVTMTGNTSDKCYIYFDIYNPPLAEYIVDLYTTQGSNGLYHHDGTLTNGISDDSYRYAGASSSVKNYVCFGSTATTCPEHNLYKIIGVFDGKVKLIKASSLGSNALDSNGSVGWSTANLNTTYLNITYLSSIGSFSDKIVETTWKAGGRGEKYFFDVNASSVYSNELINPNSVTNSSAKVGLMYVSDYRFAADYSTWGGYGYSYNQDNWMYLGSSEWTISRNTDTSSNWYIINSSGNLSSSTSSSSLTVRPVFYLDSSVTYVSGEGTSTNPYRIN